MQKPTALDLAKTLVDRESEEGFQRHIVRINKKLLLPSAVALGGCGILMVAELPSIPNKIIGLAALAVGSVIGYESIGEMREANQEIERTRQSAENLRTSLEKINGSQTL